MKILLNELASTPFPSPLSLVLPNALDVSMCSSQRSFGSLKMYVATRAPGVMSRMSLRLSFALPLGRRYAKTTVAGATSVFAALPRWMSTRSETPASSA